MTDGAVLFLDQDLDTGKGGESCVETILLAIRVKVMALTRKMPWARMRSSPILSAGKPMGRVESPPSQHA